MKRLVFSILVLSVSFAYTFGQGGEKRRSIVIEDKTTVEKKFGYIRNAFGLDFGVGGTSYNEDWWGDAGNAFTFDLGFRYLHNFSPYFGIDFFKFKFSVPIKTYNDVDYYAFNGQLMIGARGYSPTFTKSGMCAFAAFRMGGGVLVNSFEYSGDYYYSDYSYAGYGGGFCYELEVGLNITHTFFIAFCYNHQGGTITFDDMAGANGYNSSYEGDISSGNAAFRLGFNFGRVK